MDKQELRIAVAEIISDLFDHTPSEPEADYDLAEIEGWSSLNRVRFLSTIENEWEVEFVPEDLLTFGTFDGFVNLLHGKIGP